MKYIVIPSNKQMIYDLVSKVNGFIISIDNFSVNMPFYFQLEEAIELIEYLKSNDKEVFINLNKNIHNSEIEDLKKILIKLNNYDVNIMYYDIAIVNLKKKLNLKNDLVWSQEHLTTNSHTINFWYEYGAKYTLVSNEITLNEINNIHDNTNSKLMYLAFGFVPIFTSYRHLIDNYLNTFNIDKKNNKYKMYKEGNYYNVIDDKLGTTVYNYSVINAINQFDKLKIDYAIFNSAFLNTELFYNVIDTLNRRDTFSNKYNEISKMIESNTGFLFQETMYKVK